MQDYVLGMGAAMRLLVLLTTALAVAMLLAACGNEGRGPEGKADAPQEVKTEEQAQTEETTNPKAEAKTAPQKPKGKAQPSNKENYGSREEAAERFGLASNEEEAYRSNALLDIDLYRQDIKRAQSSFIDLQQGFKGGRQVPGGSPAAPPKTPEVLEKEARDSLEELWLGENPVFLENWNERVPARYEECHFLILQMHGKGIEATEPFLDYTEYYEETDLAKGLEMSKDAEALAYDAEGCLGGR